MHLHAKFQLKTPSSFKGADNTNSDVKPWFPQPNLLLELFKYGYINHFAKTKQKNIERFGF